MPPFELPLTIRAGSGPVDLVVRLPGSAPIGPHLPALLNAAGLPPETQLYAGVGPVDPTWLLGLPPLLAATVLSTSCPEAVPVAGLLEVDCVAGPDAGHRHPLAPGDTLLVGRADHADLRLDDPSLSREHAMIRVGRSGVEVCDLGSANGIEVDGDPVPGPTAAMPVGALVRLGGSVLRATMTAEPSLQVCPDEAGRVRVSRPARLRPPFRIDLEPAPGDAPVRTRRPIPLLAALLGAVAGAVIAVLTGMWTFLLLAGLGPVMMVGSAIGDRIAGRRGHRRRLAEHRSALAADARGVRAAMAADRTDAWDRYPDPATLLRRAEGLSHRLWERRPTDPDFLRLCLGIGRRPARLDRRIPFPVVEVPITVSLDRLAVLGLAGADHDTRSLLRFLVTQLAVLHAPGDLRIVICSAADELIRLRDLPHLATGPMPGAATGSELRDLRDAAERIVVILDGAVHWRSANQVRDLLRASAADAQPELGMIETDHPPRAAPSGVLAICVDTTAQALPGECTAVATVAAGKVVVRTVANRLEAEPIGVNEEYLDRILRALAPLQDPDAGTSRVPDEVALSDLWPGGTDAAQLRRRWRQPRLATPIGLGGGGPVQLDLERDGPHLLVAGTTGSGKSELLRTLLAGLALGAPPGQVNFLLIDYKGGAAFAELARLPHTTGLVTDLDGELAGRALTSLRAELRRREHLLALAHAVDLGELRSRQPDDCFPSLVIVVDEFATLAAELPDFLTGLVDVAQRGRSLGVHLVLATQRPAGVLSPTIKANMTARICLRVADVADSLDVIDRPDAARFPARCPGRAMFRFGPHRAEVFQTARLIMRPAPEIEVRLRDEPVRGVVGAVGREIDRIVAATLAAAADAPQPRPVWRPALPRRLLARPDDAGSIGLLDRPEAAEQVPVPLPATSVLIAGPPGSGRSAALHRIASCWAADGAEILLVDGVGALADIATWSSTSTALDGTDPVLVQRLLHRLHIEALSRSQRPGGPMLLVMDGFENLLAPVELLDYGASFAIFAELAGRGPAVGIRVAASGDIRVVHHRAAAQFGTCIRLGVDHRGEPRAATNPGRGRIGHHEVQLLLDGPNPPPTDQPGSSARLVVRPLPRRVGADTLPAPAGRVVPIGRGGDDAGPVTVDLSVAGGAWLVAGPRRSGVSTTLHTLALGAVQTGATVLRTISRPGPGWIGVLPVPVWDGPAQLERALLEHRGSVPVPILVICDGLPRDHPASEVLLRFLTAAGPGEFLAVGVRLDLALRSHSGLIAETATQRCGVLLQADAAEGSLLDVRLPRRRGPVIPGRGHLVRDGEAVEVQIALPASDEEAPE